MEAPRGRRRSGRPSRQASRRGWTCSTRPRCTAAGASERRVGELAEGRQVVIATQVPARLAVNGKGAPRCAGPEPGSAPAEHHRPLPTPLPVPSRLDPLPHGPHGRRGGSGEGRAIGVSNLFRGAAPRRPRGAGRAGDSSCLQPGGVLPAAPIAGGEWGAGCLPGAGDQADRLPAAGPGRPHRQVSAGESAQGDSALRPLLPG
jgi:hypothetical protein